MIRAQLLTKKPVHMIVHEKRMVLDENGKKVEVIVPELTEDGRTDFSKIPAWAIKQDYPHVHYQVHLNRPYATELFATTSIAKYVPYVAFETGLALHEIGHVDHGVTDLEVALKDNAIFMYIMNTLADTRDENWMAYRFPGYSPFIQVALSVLKYVTPSRSEKDGIFPYLHALFHLVRFGKVVEKADTKFVSFALPHVISATSLASSAENLLNAAYSIYAYLLQLHTDDEGELSQEFKDAVGNTQTIGQMVAVNAKDVQNGIGKNGTTVMQTDMANIAKQIKDGVPLEKLAGGKLAGIGGHPLQIESDGAFARSVQIEYADTIASLRREYMTFYEQMLMRPMFEGELSEDVDQQQELYIAMCVGDEYPGYDLPEPLVPSLEQLIKLDVSDSTTSFRVAYAKSVVIILSALEGVPGFRTGLIRFNHDAEMVKGFDDELQECDLDPQASGGTCLDDAIDIMQSSYSWREAIRLNFVITDGDIRNIDEAASIYRRLEKEQGIVTWLVDLQEGSCSMSSSNMFDNSFVCAIKDLPQAIASHVMTYIRGKYYGA